MALLALLALQNDPDPALIERLQASLVIVQTRDTCGSGFVVRADRDTGYVVTNEHVVARYASATVTLWAATKQEKALEAKVVSADPDRNLALLRIEGFKDLPAAVDLSKPAAPEDAMSILILGFPTAVPLQDNFKAPAPRPGRGTVTAVRKDEFGRIQSVELDVETAPSCSGALVIDSKGQPVGVAEARKSNTRQAFLVPAADVTDMFRGRVAGIKIAQAGLRGRSADLKVEARMIDPLEKIKSVEFYYAHAAAAKGEVRRERDGRWAKLPRSMVIRMKIEGGMAAIQLKLAHDRAEEIEFLGQLSFVNSDGKTVYTPPVAFKIHFGEFK